MDGFVYILAACVALVLLFLLLYRSVYYFENFSRELRYLNSEVSRTRGEEQEYWRLQRRRLWLSLLPFFSYDE